jgi:hypothetical protein
MRRRHTTAFADIAEEFARRVERMVWCNAATVDTRGRPRSRLLHPVWERDVCWITTRRHSLKARHLARTPYLSLAYTADFATPVFIDCAVEWVDDLDQRRRIWSLLAAAPRLQGFDPTRKFGQLENPECGLLRLTPWRIEVATPPAETHVWHASLHGLAAQPALHGMLSA